MAGVERGRDVVKRGRAHLTPENRLSNPLQIPKHFLRHPERTLLGGGPSPFLQLMAVVTRVRQGDGTLRAWGASTSGGKDGVSLSTPPTPPDPSQKNRFSTGVSPENAICSKNLSRPPPAQDCQSSPADQIPAKVENNRSRIAKPETATNE